MSASFDPTFYATVAQVIPVLLIVVFVELLLSRRELTGTTGANLYLLATFTLVVGAEISCLRALKVAKTPTEWEDAVIIGGLLWPGLVLTIAVLGPILSQISERAIGAWLLLLYLIGLVVGLVLAADGVIGWSAWIVAAASAPAAAVCVISVIEIVPKAYRKTIATWWVSGRRMTAGEPPPRASTDDED